jgi:hypothetical protein
LKKLQNSNGSTTQVSQNQPNQLDLKLDEIVELQKELRQLLGQSSSAEADKAEPSQDIENEKANKAQQPTYKCTDLTTLSTKNNFVSDLHDDLATCAEFEYQKSEEGRQRKVFTPFPEEKIQKPSFSRGLNMLARTDGWKWKSWYVFSVMALLAEYWVFAAIANNVLNMNESILPIGGFEIKSSHIVALIVFAFSKAVQAAIQPIIQVWIQQHGTKARKRIYVIILVGAGLILLNGLFLGFLNADRGQKNYVEGKISKSSDGAAETRAKIDLLRKDGADPSIIAKEEKRLFSREAEQAKWEAQGIEDPRVSGTIGFFKYLSIALITFLSILTTAFIWSIASLLRKANGYKVKLDEYREEIAKLRGNFNALLGTRANLLSIQKSVIGLLAKKRLLQSLGEQLIHTSKDYPLTLTRKT